MINRLQIAKVRNLLWDFAGRLTLNKTLQEIHALAIDMIKYKLFKFSKDKKLNASLLIMLKSIFIQKV